MIAANTNIAYERFNGSVLGQGVQSRWIGRCKRCQAKHKIEGELMSAFAPATERSASRHDYVIRATDGQIYTMAHNGSDTSSVPVRCGDHWCYLRRVHEGTKQSKHECGARCTNATGPSCDCRCRGKNHGKNC